MQHGHSRCVVKTMVQACAAFAAFASVALLAGGADAKTPIVLPRAGQVGFALDGGYGGMTSNGDLGEFVSHGGALAVRIRYRMKYERAFGISFEQHQMLARTSAADTLDKIGLTLTGVEMYQMFNTTQKNVGMVGAGLGIAHPVAYLKGGDKSFPDDGFFVGLSAGLERFFWRSVAWDASARYYGIIQHQKINNDFQASLGLIFYATY